MAGIQHENIIEVDGVEIPDELYWGTNEIEILIIMIGVLQELSSLDSAYSTD